MMGNTRRGRPWRHSRRRPRRRRRRPGDVPAIPDATVPARRAHAGGRTLFGSAMVADYLGIYRAMIDDVERTDC